MNFLINITFIFEILLSKKTNLVKNLVKQDKKVAARPAQIQLIFQLMHRKPVICFYKLLRPTCLVEVLKSGGILLQNCQNIFTQLSLKI